MKRMLFSLLLCLLFLGSPVLTVLAAENQEITEELPYISDYADVLTAEEELLLEIFAQSIQKEYAIDPVIVTIHSLNGKTAQNYADDYYDMTGYADNGILFLLAMDEREWYISTCGSVIYAVTDYTVQQLGDITVWYLSEGYYYDGFNAYLNELSSYLDAYENGRPVDGYADYSKDYYHGQREEVVYYDSHSMNPFPIALLIGLVAAVISIIVMHAAMNTKRPQRSAGAYLRNGTFRLRLHQDLFLYSNVSKVRRQQNNGSGSRGGGSSVHRSSGGRRHGGGGGRF